MRGVGGKYSRWVVGLLRKEDSCSGSGLGLGVGIMMGMLEDLMGSIGMDEGRKVLC